MQDFLSKVSSLIDSYKEQLSSVGIKITVSKKYFETAVMERSGGCGVSAIFNSIDRAKDRKAEKKNGYNYVRNKYHCVVLSILPLDKKLVSHMDCKDYSFLLRKSDRAHIGLEPRSIDYEEGRLISKIEKRILKTIKKAQRTDVAKTCKNSIFDALRYTHSIRYEYKKIFCGKDESFWDMLFTVLAGVLTILIVFSVWFFGKLL